MSAAPDGRPWTRFLADMPGSPIAWLAAEAGLSYGELSMYLVGEVNRRRQTRYAMHAHAYEQLDRRLDRLRIAPPSDPQIAQNGPGG